MATYGYARVSTRDQDLDAQVQQLRAGGAVRVYAEKVSGASRSRPELATCLDDLREGDTLLVVAVSRLGRSLNQLIGTLNELGERGIHLRSLTEGFDTNTPGGELLFNVLGAVAQWERQLIVERTKAGQDAARRRGARIGGRERIMTDEKCALVCRLWDDGNTKAQIAAMVGVSWTSVHNAIRAREGAALSSSQLAS